MGTNDILLAVATDDRQYQVRVTPGFALTDSQLSDVQLNSIEPALRDSDWAGAALSAAEGLEAGVSGQSQPDTGQDIADDGQVQPDTDQSSGRGSGTMIMILIVLVAVGLVLCFVRRRRVSPVAQSTPEIPAEQLGQEAGMRSCTRAMPSRPARRSSVSRRFRR